MTMARLLVLALALCATTPADSHAQDQPPAEQDAVFSGPQVGEALPPFKVRGVYDEDAGKELDFVQQAAGKPIVLIFVHDANRPSISLVRLLTAYTVERAKDGLTTGVVWLDDDVTEAENTLKRIRHALTPAAPTGISLDGQEGPGSYGLNRNIILTILVGNEGQATANFALVQPSIQSDLPEILKEVVRVAGGTAPRLADIPGAREMRMREPTANRADANLAGLLRPLIQRDATREDVERAAAAVERHVGNHDAARQEVGRIATTVVNGGKLADYGTPLAQRYLRKWAREYGEPRPEQADDGGSDR